MRHTIAASIAALMTAALLSSGATAAIAAPTDAVDFGTQAGLYTCVKVALDSEQVTEAQLASLSTLACEGGGIADISVLAGATGLTSLDLRYNRITDASVLAGLTNLTFLALGYQDVSLPPTKPNVPYALPVIAGGMPITIQQGVIGDITDGKVTWVGPGYATLTWSGLVPFGAGKQTTFSGSMHQFVMYQLQGADAKIDGIAKVGEPLTAVAGIGNANASFAYVWMADAAAITGAEAQLYSPVEADLGKVISVEITVSQGGYFPFVSTSATTAPVVAGDPKPDPTPSATETPAPVLVVQQETGVQQETVVQQQTQVAQPAVIHSAKPTIRGTARVGKKLTARPGPWTPGTTLSYRWLANGKQVGTKSTLTLTKKTRGKRITVTVTGSRAGYVTAASTSKATAKVK